MILVSYSRLLLPETFVSRWFYSGRWLCAYNNFDMTQNRGSLVPKSLQQSQLPSAELEQQAQWASSMNLQHTQTHTHTPAARRLSVGFCCTYLIDSHCILCKVHCCTLQEENVITGIQRCTKKKECDEQRNESFLVNRERARGLFVCKIQYNKPTNERTIFGLDLLVLFLLLLSNYHEWQNFANFWQDLSDLSILRGSLLKDRTRSGCSNYDQLGIQEVCLLGYCV
jgi:hypothetical protein